MKPFSPLDNSGVSSQPGNLAAAQTDIKSNLIEREREREREREGKIK
jgi:hypothetical protein